MKLIALSMLRVFETLSEEWRDAIDVRWSHFLTGCGLQPLYIPNNPSVAAGLLEQLKPDGVLLTGGGSCLALTGVADFRDDTENLLLEWATQQRLPVLGVCRGMQVMLCRAGAILEPVEGHVGPHDIHYRSEVRRVNSFHHYGFLSVPPSYEIDGISEDGVIEAVSNPSARHTALMWHPERNQYFESADQALVRRVYGVSP